MFHRAALAGFNNKPSFHARPNLENSIKWGFHILTKKTNNLDGDQERVN